MIKPSVFPLAFLAICLTSWLLLDSSIVSAFSAPLAEESQAILSSISEANRERAGQGVYLPGKAREDFENARALEDFLRRSNQNEDDSFFYGDDDIEKRRLRESKRRLRGSKRQFTEDKRRLRFVKRREFLDGDVAPEEGLSPRLRYHNIRRREAFSAGNQGSNLAGSF